MYLHEINFSWIRLVKQKIIDTSWILQMCYLGWDYVSNKDKRNKIKIDWCFNLKPSCYLLVISLVLQETAIVLLRIALLRL